MGSADIEKPEIGCLLALHAARCLTEPFRTFYKWWTEHAEVARFLSEINEEIELDVGSGINYGKIRFGYVGRSATQGARVKSERADLSSHLEYTAFGDHMNTAARLADAASKLEAEVDILLRGSRFRDSFRLMPVLVSHSAIVKLVRTLNADDLHDRKGMIRLKGKGQGVSFYEIGLREVDPLRCAHLLKDVAGGQYARCLEGPPELTQYLRRLREDLDIIREASSEVSVPNYTLHRTGARVARPGR